MNPPSPNLRDRDLDGPGDPILPKEVSQKARGTLEIDAPGLLFSWLRILRGVCVALSILWMVLFHVGIISQAPFRVPFRIKLLHTIITFTLVSMCFFCLRGRSRIVIG